MNRKYISIIGFVLLIIVVVFIGSITTLDNFKETFLKKDTVNTINIGVIEPLSGEYANFGKEEVQGFKLANKLHNKVNGKTVKLIVEDTQSNILVAEAIAKDMIRKNPVAVLGSYGDAVTLAMEPYFKKANIVAISVSATNPLITKDSPFYFRTSTGDENLGNGVSEFFFKGLNQKKVAVLELQGDMSVKGQVRYFRESFRKNTKDEKSVLTMDLNQEDKDYKEVLKHLKKEKISSVFAPVDKDTYIKIFTSAKQNKVKGMTFVANGSLSKEDLEAIAKIYDGIKIVTPNDFGIKRARELNDIPPYQDDKESVELMKDFLKAYKKEYGEEPSQEAARAYDGYMILMKALKNTGGEGGKQLGKAIKSIDLFNGVTGDFKFNNQGEAIKTISFYTLTKNKLVLTYVVNDFRKLSDNQSDGKLIPTDKTQEAKLKDAKKEILEDEKEEANAENSEKIPSEEDVDDSKEEE